MKALSGAETRPRVVNEAVRKIQEKGVTGPASGTDGNVALLDGATGRLIKDGGYVPARPGANTDITSVYLDNTGLKVKDTNASHGLTLKPGSDITADRTLTLTTGDANRTLTLTADSSIGGTAYVSGGTDVPVADGGTGASTASAARDNLGAEPLGAFYGINTQTDSYTLVLGDAGKLIEMNKASANNLTVPPNSSVAFATNTRIDIAQYGAGQTTVVAGSGVTIRSKAGNLKLSAQYSAASLYKRATDEWVLVGDLTA